MFGGEIVVFHGTNTAKFLCFCNSGGVGGATYRFPPVDIVAIERIQNLKLYKYFVLFKEDMAKEVDPNEQLLFHGSRVNAKNIAEDGFDMRVCKLFPFC